MGTNVLEVSLKSTAHVHVCHLELYIHIFGMSYIYILSMYMYIIYKYIYNIKKYTHVLRFEASFTRRVCIYKRAYLQVHVYSCTCTHTHIISCHYYILYYICINIINMHTVHDMIQSVNSW